MECIFAMIPFDGIYQKLQKTPAHFCASSYRFRDLNILNFLRSKVGQGHGEQFWQ